MIDDSAEGSIARLGRGEQTNTVSVPKECADAMRSVRTLYLMEDHPPIPSNAAIISAVTSASGSVARQCSSAVRAA